MKKVLLLSAAFLLALGVAHPPAAEARVFVGVGLGCCGYYPYPYPAYAPYYVAPPPVVYAVPPPSPVVYAAPPAQATYYSAPPAPVSVPAPIAAPAASAQTSSPTFIDSQGRTCRQVQTTTSSGSPAYDTACLMPDGSWRTLQ
jgi:hypothetical protein